MSKVDATARVRALADRQFGRIKWSQLNRVGIADGTINAWVHRGYLHPELPGVYSVGHRAPSVEGDLAASLLYAGPGAMLSHVTALWWWGLLDKQPYTTEISTPRRLASRDRLKIHRRRTIDRAWHNGLPVTSTAQTLLDFARTASPNRLRYVLAEAEYHELLDLAELQEMLGPGRPGTLKLRAALERHMPQLARTRSELERLFLPLCEAAGLPLPEVNVWIDGELIDAVWPEHKVTVELDGGRGHLSRWRMVRDRRKDLKLRAAGYLVLRYTWDQLEQEPDLVIADLTAALASRAA